MRMATRKLARMGRRTARRTARVPLRVLSNLQPFKYLKERRSFPLRHFEPKIHVFQSTENFILKTADSPFELRQVLKLRHEIFFKELQGKENESQIDIDEFDSICDHLIIIDKKSSRVIGTYRVISSLFSDKFYSQGEFGIDELLRAPGNKLELGRACIHKDFRNGAIINLLWKGIFEYVKKTDTKYLFGCASVQTTDPVLASEILAYLGAKGLTSDEYKIGPTEKYRSELLDVAPHEGVEKEVPALIHSYIKAGAKFHGKPALDHDFDCYDYFMLLKIDEMSALFRRRFG